MLRNFQKHKKKTIHFRTDRRVTIIAGRNGAGKSAVVRALRWLFLCDGSDGLRQHGAEYVKVLARFEGDRSAARKIGKERYYQVDDQKIVATGRSVPEAVCHLSGLSPLNFQVQHDGLFWVSSSAGMIGKEVGRLSGIQPIVKAMDIARGELRELKAKVKFHTEASDESQTYLEDTKWVDEALFSMQEQEQIEVELRELTNKIAIITQKVSTVRKFTISGMSEDELRGMSEAAHQMSEAFQQLLKRDTEVRQVCQRHLNLQKEVERDRSILEQLRDSSRSIKTCPACRQVYSQ